MRRSYCRRAFAASALRRLEVRPGLGDLFGAIAVAQPFHDLPLGCHLRLGLGDLFRTAAVAQPFHDVPLGRHLRLSLRHLRL